MEEKINLGIERNPTFDIMKGICILLMMLCHLVIGNNNFIYSFHMPLFFFISGYLHKNIENVSSFALYSRKNVKRLLLPFYVTMLLLCTWGGIQSVLKLDETCLLKYCFALFLANVDKISFTFNDELYFPYIGPLWFLWALFWCKEIFVIIQIIFKRYQRCDELTLLSSIIISSIVLYIQKIYFIPLPFCINQGLIAIIFYSIGWYIKNKSSIFENKIIFWGIIGLIAMWILSVLYGSINLESSSIKLYPLELFGALGATLVIYIVISNITKYKSVSKIITPIRLCGRFSLVILCMHTLELYSGFIYSLICRFPRLDILVGYGQIAICLIMSYIVLRIPILKLIYK